ncbi:citrate lyase holo-[acyl-carrier protein] synthase [Clostridium tyrobutyricum]|uniref:citrate lyase holo-[acyl-carrier protein] synthase n=1 Tax=Clostridium tyrobutyricum TaxID=1519 RepID=UPI001C385BA9|nr:citrate lyase holo-[acyl-carrier protein] synthase [Clostridium tyrobutyricum]MBV4419022.1 citrate lyase holo-[acyl-carrier protein] synthase [Clostridium tyrobutyricum]
MIDNDESKQELIRDIYIKCISKNYNGLESMLSENYTQDDMMKARQDRIHKQEWLIKDYFASLISARVSYPGSHKNDCIAFEIMKELGPVLVDKFKNKIMYKNLRVTAEGPILTIIVNEDVNYIKRETVRIEEGSSIGKCMYIDVYDTDGNIVTRRDIGLKSKNCYICNEDADICARTEKHTSRDIRNNIIARLEEYLKNSK